MPNPQKAALDTLQMSGTTLLHVSGGSTSKRVKRVDQNTKSQTPPTSLSFSPSHNAKIFQNEKERASKTLKLSREGNWVSINDKQSHTRPYSLPGKQRQILKSLDYMSFARRATGGT